MMSEVKEKETSKFSYLHLPEAIQEATKKQLIHLNNIMEENQKFFKERKNLEIVLNQVRDLLYLEKVSSSELEKTRDTLREVIADQKPNFNAIKSCIVQLGKTISVLNEAFDVKH